MAPSKRPKLKPQHSKLKPSLFALAISRSTLEAAIMERVLIYMLYDRIETCTRSTIYYYVESLKYDLIQGVQGIPKVRITPLWSKVLRLIVSNLQKTYKKKVKTIYCRPK